MIDWDSDEAHTHHHTIQQAGVWDVSCRILPHALVSLARVAVFSAAATPAILKHIPNAPQLPARLASIAMALGPFWKACVLQQGLRRLARFRVRRRRARIVKGTADGLLERAALERESTTTGASPALLRDMTLHELCSFFNTELQEIKRLLLESGHQLPVQRWDRTNSELMRFAVCCGMLEVGWVWWWWVGRWGLRSIATYTAYHIPAHQCIPPVYPTSVSHHANMSPHTDHQYSAA